MRTKAGRSAGRATLMVAAALASLAAAVTPPEAEGQQTVAFPARRAAGWLGLGVVESVTTYGAGQPTTSIVVSRVIDGGPSDIAGLRPGDRVVRVNGREAHPAVFNEFASLLAPGERLRLQVIGRTGRAREVVVTAGQAPVSGTLLVSPEMTDRIEDKLRALDSLRVTLESRTGMLTVHGPDGERTVMLPGLRPAREGVVLTRMDTTAGAPREGFFEVRGVQAPGPLEAWVEGQNWLAGGRFTELTPDLAAYFRVERGLLVTEIIDGTLVADAGVRAGDVLVAVDGRPVTSLAAARIALQPATTRGVRLALVRHGQRVEVRLGG